MGLTLTILEPQNDLRCSVEPANQVRRDLIVSREHSAAKVSQLNHRAACTDQDVVWLDVSMQHSTVAQMVEGDEHLSRVLRDSGNVQANATAILLGQLAQVDVLQMQRSKCERGKAESVGSVCSASRKAKLRDAKEAAAVLYQQPNSVGTGC